MDYSVVTSIYKDAHLAGNFCRDVAAVFAAHLGIKEDELGKVLEIILVNDGGPGESLMQLLAIQRQYDFVRVADLSRNFGQHEALACGFHLARGKYVLRMNVDMQDRPSEIPKLLRAMTLETVHYLSRTGVLQELPERLRLPAGKRSAPGGEVPSENP